MDMVDGATPPRRGDLVNTNVGNKRERTCFVLRSHVIRSRTTVPRVHLWIERWWELEPEFRVRLYRSAERRGGQRCFWFRRNRSKKKRLTFEAYMRQC